MVLPAECIQFEWDGRDNVPNISIIIISLNGLDWAQIFDLRTNPDIDYMVGIILSSTLLFITKTVSVCTCE